MTYTPPEGVSIGTFTADTLPASFNAPAGAVVSYKIYGTSEGAGVATESGEPAGYKIPILCESGVTENLFDGIIYQDDTIITTQSGATQSNSNYALGNYINVGDATVITMAFQYGHDTTTTRSFFPGLFYDAQQNLMGTNIAARKPSEGAVEIHITVPTNAKYFQPQWKKTTDTDIMVILGSTAPDHYIPHRYTSNYDLMIGDTKLGEDEYVDFATQKIYKLQEGELTPTVPPLPLPSIITYDAENTLSSTETLGEVEFTGVWLAIMGSTEDESIDIEFTVDAEEYIAFVTVDDDPQIQVSDTITLPSSADSFTLEVVSWGRERYTETVYNDLS